MRVQEKLFEFKKAFDAFIPVVRMLEDTVPIWEGEIENMKIQKARLLEENKKAVADCEALIGLEKDKVAAKFAEAEAVLKSAKEIYLKAYKSQVTEEVLSKDEVAQRNAEVGKKAEEIKKLNAKV